MTDILSIAIKSNEIAPEPQFAAMPRYLGLNTIVEPAVGIKLSGFQKVQLLRDPVGQEKIFDQFFKMSDSQKKITLFLRTYASYKKNVAIT